MLKGSERECLHSFSPPPPPPRPLPNWIVLMARSHIASFSVGASSSPLPSFSVVLPLSGCWFSS